MTYKGGIVYAVRGINKYNFNPMVWSLIDSGFMKNYIQVLIDVVGGVAWVNVRENEVTE